MVPGSESNLTEPSSLPPNCRFEVSDASEEWYFSEKFDYIHGRLFATCFSDPAFVLTQAFILSPLAATSICSTSTPASLASKIPTKEPTLVDTEKSCSMGRRSWAETSLTHPNIKDILRKRGCGGGEVSVAVYYVAEGKVLEGAG